MILQFTIFENLHYYLIDCLQTDINYKVVLNVKSYYGPHRLSGHCEKIINREIIVEIIPEIFHQRIPGIFMRYLFQSICLNTLEIIISDCVISGKI